MPLHEHDRPASDTGLAYVEATRAELQQARQRDRERLARVNWERLRYPPAQETP
jgi:hypothetical protein